jgi:Asp-tRNA(Asn)/Glu-tRNA(Gln) amidotransferase A subunit family amidase
MTAPHGMTASEAMTAMRKGRLTSVRLVRHCLDRIAEREPEIRTWAALDSEGALAEALLSERLGLECPVPRVAQMRHAL